MDKGWIDMNDKKCELCNRDMKVFVSELKEKYEKYENKNEIEYRKMVFGKKIEIEKKQIQICYGLEDFQM